MNLQSYIKRSIKLPLAFLLLAASLSICFVGIWATRGEWLYPEQLQSGNVLATDLGVETIGQTFVARQAGLEAIELMLDLPANTSGELTLHLREAPDSVQDIRNITVRVDSAVSNDGWLHFTFEPLNDSRTRYYYFFIASSADNADEQVAVHYAGPDAYPDGALHVNGNPQEGQLTFRLAYDRLAMLQDLARSATAAIPKGITAILVFTLPGWGLLVLFLRNSDGSLIQHWLEAASVVVGLSIAVYPVLYLWTDLFGWHPGELLVWITVGASAMLLVWHYRPWRLRWKNVSAGIRAWTDSKTIWADSATLLVLLAATAGRLLMVRGLEMPFWHDSVQHAIITQRIMEAGGLFQSWMPYSPHTTFSFHFGFHLNSAVFGWVTNMNAPQAMIWGGQLFNVMAVFTLYALAYRLKGVWAGTIAVLAAGLFTQFPLYYTNWGRYPQMIGQAVLPAAAWWTWVNLETRRTKQRFPGIAWLLGGAILIVGSMLGYYRMVLNYLTFVTAALIVHARSPSNFVERRKWLGLAGGAVAGLVLILPQLGRLLSSMGAPDGSGTAAPPAPVSIWNKIAAVPIVLPAPQALVLLLGTVLLIWGRRKASLPVIWFWLLIALPIVAVTSLPGANLISGIAVSTSLYIPIALVMGVAGGVLFAKLPLAWAQPLTVLLLLGLAAIQLTRMPGLVIREYDLSSRPDMQAAAWIRDNLPEDAFFLINGFEYKQTPAASDAGWWLPLLTKRQTNIPPQYATFVEKPVIAGYRQTTTRFVEQLYEQPPGSEEGKSLICDFPYPITHVYIGQKRGIIKGPAEDVTTDRPMLPVEQLLGDPAYKLIYQRDRVMIFEFNRAFCAGG